MGKGGEDNSVWGAIPAHGHFVLSPVLVPPGDQDGGLSNSTTDIYDLTEK